MMRTPAYALLGIALVASPVSAGSTAAQGLWADEDQEHVYAFLTDDQLTYWSKTKYHADPNASYVRSDGTWQAKEPMCWMGKRTGNMVLSANQQKCCMEVKSSGDKLILKSIWGEPKADFGLCRERVLSRVESASALRLPGGFAACPALQRPVVLTDARTAR